jgi:tRNA threonylcarbamoyladenosine biosynthesis protein TsaE
MVKIITRSEKETFEFAKKYAQTLKGGEVIGLIGDLGAGKTVFVKGVAAGLGIKKTITSPTFVLMKVYPVRKHKTIKNLVHIDAYRLKGEVWDLGLNEYLNNETAIIIEWPSKIRNYLKIVNTNYKIEIDNSAECLRIIKSP